MARTAENPMLLTISAAIQFRGGLKSFFYGLLSSKFTTIIKISHHLFINIQDADDLFSFNHSGRKFRMFVTNFRLKKTYLCAKDSEPLWSPEVVPFFVCVFFQSTSLEI